MAWLRAQVSFRVTRYIMIGIFIGTTVFAPAEVSAADSRQPVERPPIPDSEEIIEQCWELSRAKRESIKDVEILAGNKLTLHCLREA